MAGLALVDKLLDLNTKFPLQLPQVAEAGDEEVLKLWRSHLAQGLAFVPPDKPLGTELFDALNLMEPHFAFEGVHMRNNPEGGAIEVYMMKRADNDTAYPGQVHCPGSAIRNGEDWWAVAHRLGRGEFKTGVKMIYPLYEAGFFYQEKRGWYLSLPIIVELETDPEIGKWFPVDNLPENTVEHHRHKIIPLAVRFWNNRELHEAGRYFQKLALSEKPEEVDQTELRRQLAFAFKYVTGRTLGPLYAAVAPLTINDSVELGVIRRVGDELQGYMVKRGADDPRYPNQWMFVGTQQLPGEGDADVVLRAMTKKYPDVNLRGEAIFIRRLTSPDIAREEGGMHINPHFWLVVGNNDHLPVDETHGWFPLNSLPTETVWSHAEIFVPIFHDAFLRYEEHGKWAVAETVEIVLSELRNRPEAKTTG